MDVCVVCGKSLLYDQGQYCSQYCEDNHTTYTGMKQRSRRRKQELVAEAGGCCQVCGYSANLSALNFHHLDPDQKTQSFNVKRLRYALDDDFYKEIENCVLLCTNCHMEEHYPDLVLAELRQREWPEPIPNIRSEKHTHCIQCGTELTGRQRQFCSKTCRSKYTWANRTPNKPRPKRHKNCVICETPLKGNQRKFCSQKCKNAHHQNYDRQQERGIGRKLLLVEQLGGACSVCGYNHNLAALNFHHVESDEKEHKVDLRHLSNRSWEAILAEIEKCVLVCANCHAALHNPELATDSV